jgi:hypothetical protein
VLSLLAIGRLWESAKNLGRRRVFAMEAVTEIFVLKANDVETLARFPIRLVGNKHVRDSQNSSASTGL